MSRFLPRIVACLLALVACGKTGPASDLPRDIPSDAASDAATDVTDNIGADAALEVASDAAQDLGPRDPASGILPGVNFYPRVIRLRYGPDAGRILATTNDGAVGRVWSSDDGATFSLLSEIPPGDDARFLCCITLFEFPQDIAGLPAGTLIWSGSIATVTEPPRHMDLRIWKSIDGGRTWERFSSCATSTLGDGLWEPAFHVANDGRLVCMYSDGTDPQVHSQMLAQSVSDDGGRTFGPGRTIVAMESAWPRPGMVTATRLPDSSWVMTYELCAWFPNCVVRMRRSLDGLDWGPLADEGETVALPDGSQLAHAPVVTWTPAGGPDGTVIVSGQLMVAADGSPSPGSGQTLFVNPEAGVPATGWRAIPAPVPVPEAYDNFCPNYSSPVLDLDGQGFLLELASYWDGTDCRTKWARVVTDLAAAPLDP